jgi:branched-chain amino acid transport system permease protein
LLELRVFPNLWLDLAGAAIAAFALVAAFISHRRGIYYACRRSRSADVLLSRSRALGHRGEDGLLNLRRRRGLRLRRLRLKSMPLFYCFGVFTIVVIAL